MGICVCVCSCVHVSNGASVSGVCVRARAYVLARA